MHNVCMFIMRKFYMKNELKNRTEEKNNAVVPTNVFVFKRIFGMEGNERITKSLLSSILEEEVTSINLKGNTIMEGDILSDKLNILDIRAEINGKVEVDIEMQLATQNYIEERLLYYWSKLYSRTVSKGETYEKTKKTVAILITDFELKNKKNKPYYHFRYKAVDIKNLKKLEDVYESLLTEDFEIDIIELPKIKKLDMKTIKDKKARELISWANFLINPDSTGVGEMDEIKEAKEELEKIRLDEIESWRAEMRQKFIADEKVRRISAIEDGIEQGEQNAKIKIAKNLLKEKVDIQIIISATGLTREEIEKIKNENNLN